MKNNDWQALWVNGQVRNCKNYRQQHRKNRSAHVAMIGALPTTQLFYRLDALLAAQPTVI